jgi:phosphomannomutase/phosphoglucomutase
MMPSLSCFKAYDVRGKPGDELDEGIACPCCGEINYRVNNVVGSIETVLAHYLPQNPAIDRTDGVSVEFTDWRFNLRGSNTEPLLRLNVETRGNTKAVSEHADQIAALIGAVK